MLVAIIYFKSLDIFIFVKKTKIDIINRLKLIIDFESGQSQDSENMGRNFHMFSEIRRINGISVDI